MPSTAPAIQPRQYARSLPLTVRLRPAELDRLEALALEYRTNRCAVASALFRHGLAALEQGEPLAAFT
jgi:hypothetical protein